MRRREVARKDARSMSMSMSMSFRRRLVFFFSRGRGRFLRCHDGPRLYMGMGMQYGYARMGAYETWV